MEYVDRHTEEARRWHARMSGVTPENKYDLPNHDEYCDRVQRMHRACAFARMKQPCILAMDGANNCPYSSEKLFRTVLGHVKGTAIGHLLAIGGLMHSSHEYYLSDYRDREQRTSLASDVSCHEWSDGVRLVGVRTVGAERMGRGMPSLSRLLEDKLDKVTVPNVAVPATDFWHLVTRGGRFYTDAPKDGERMDRGVPEFPVNLAREVGKAQFKTTFGGYHGFFKYGIDEVRRIAPPGANAYVVGEIEIESTAGSPTHHVAEITFFAVEVDASKRVLTDGEVYANEDLVMELVEDQA